MLPDGTYAVWRGKTYPARSRVNRSRVNPVSWLLQMPDADSIPAGYEADRPGSPWIQVPESELTELFALNTYAVFNGLTCPVSRHVPPDGKLQIGAFGIGEERAKAEDWTPTFERGEYVRLVDRSELTDLRQKRRDIPLDEEK